MTAVPAFGICRRWRRHAAVGRIFSAGRPSRTRGTDRALGRHGRGRLPAPHPDSHLGSSSIWPHIGRPFSTRCWPITTIAFVNSRGLCEKLTARFERAAAKRPRSGRAPFRGGRLRRPRREATAFAMMVRGVLHGPGCHAAPSEPARHRLYTVLVTEPAVVIAKAHHGSVSKEKRLQVERGAEGRRAALRGGHTSSLELALIWVPSICNLGGQLLLGGRECSAWTGEPPVGGRSRGVIFRAPGGGHRCRRHGRGMEAGAIREHASRAQRVLDAGPADRGHRGHGAGRPSSRRSVCLRAAVGLLRRFGPALLRGSARHA